VQATVQKPYILTHKHSGERYAYSEAQLARTRRMYADKGMRLETHYTIVKEYQS
jgi:hypothetical protein